MYSEIPLNWTSKPDTLCIQNRLLFIFK